METHPDMRVQRLRIGREQAPLLVVDNFVADPEALVATAASLQFTPLGRFYPGIRVDATHEYRHLLLSFMARLGQVIREDFGIQGRSMRFTMCHYSLVTLPATQLAVLQRIPHVDSLSGNGVATIHYLFKKDLGGTAFYRHRKTGFESIDEARGNAYFVSLQNENDGPNMPGAAYINGDTALFEEIARQDGVFNRMLIYKRNSLHSGCIAPDFVPDPSPLTGRLSINSFIDFEP
jgi:hypothetical protein